MENKLIAVVKEVGDLIQYRRVGKPDLYKKVLVLETDDNQVLYPEIRNSALKLLEREGIEEGVQVEITYLFQGSEKDGKKYNNILIQSIKRI